MMKGINWNCGYLNDLLTILTKWQITQLFGGAESLRYPDGSLSGRRGLNDPIMTPANRSH